MNIKFKVVANSSQQETDLIWDKLKMIRFLEDHRYLISLPDHPLIDQLLEKARINALNDSDYQALSDLMEQSIYCSSDYQVGIEAIQACLNQQFDYPFLTRYNKLWNFKLFAEYEVRLTLYGPGGEYRPDSGTIIILTTKSGSFRRGDNPLVTMIHEMIHIGLEEAIIQTYNIPHIVKEQIVDLFAQFHFSDLLPNYLMQTFVPIRIKDYLKSQADWDTLPEVLDRFIRENNPPNNPL